MKRILVSMLLLCVGAVLAAGTGGVSDVSAALEQLGLVSGADVSGAKMALDRLGEGNPVVPQPAAYPIDRSTADDVANLIRQVCDPGSFDYHNRCGSYHRGLVGSLPKSFWEKLGSEDVVKIVKALSNHAHLAALQRIPRSTWAKVTGKDFLDLYHGGSNGLYYEDAQIYALSEWVASAGPGVRAEFVAGALERVDHLNQGKVLRSFPSAFWRSLDVRSFPSALWKSVDGAGIRRLVQAIRHPIDRELAAKLWAQAHSAAE